MAIDWISYFNLTCSIAGILFFVLTLRTIHIFKKFLPATDIIRKWQILQLLIIFFLIGYGLNILFSMLEIQNLFLLLVALIYFFGGCFVLIIVSLVNRTYKALYQTVQRQDHHLETILKVSKFKTDFLSTMSHELRTPLNAIMGFTDLILEGSYGRLNKEQREFLEGIESSAEFQYEMIRNFLDILKIEFGKLILNYQEFSLLHIVNQILEIVKKAIDDKKLGFNMIGMSEEQVIYADPIRLKEILYLLIDNSIKFTKNGDISLIFQESINNYIFQVRDTGIGIDPKEHDLIFNDFYKVDNKNTHTTEGSGLGLPLCKRLIELHGGDITLESNPGKGTTFTFRIPRNHDT